MPIYMDRHDVSDSVTAENVAELHQKDLKVQHQFGCRGLTYWFDDIRKTAFCLIEAPDAAKLKEMHDFAHGEVPHRIIEVDPLIVESFLGRIEDPEKARDAQLNIINDPAFRIIMVVELEVYSLKKLEEITYRSLNENYKKNVHKAIQKFEGRFAAYKENRIMVSFTSVTKAVKCALKLQSGFRKNTVRNMNEPVGIKISLNAGLPVTEKETLFEDTVKLAEGMTFINSNITISEEIKDLYVSENLKHPVLDEQIFVLSAADQKFLAQLMDFTDNEWQNNGLTVESFQRHLGFSKSQLYRKMTLLTGNSPNNFLLLYRLKRVFHLLHNKNHSVSEIAYAGGFNSPSYFTKCFRKTYGLSPSAFKSLI